MSRNPDTDTRPTLSSKSGTVAQRSAARARASPRTAAGGHTPEESALQRAALAVSAAGGARVYDVLIAELADVLGVDVAFVAVFDDVDRTRMRTLAAVLDGRALRNFDYALAGSPCAQVVGRDFRFVPKGVAAEFAPDTIFAAKGMDCYAAYPLTGAGGAPLGLLVAMNRRALADPTLAESMLKIFAVRIAAEIERGRAEDALRRAALAVSGAEGENVYRELVRVLATILGVEIAFIALPKAEDSCKLKMLAFWIDGRIVEDFEYPLAGTPCEQILREGYCAYPDRLTERFPLDADFRSIGAESYAGLPLASADGSPMGIISVVSRKPLPNPELVEAMLKIFAARARTEIERARADAALRASEEQYRAIFNASADALVLWDSSLRRVDVNPAYERIYGIPREEVLRGDYGADLPVEYAERRRDLVRRTLAGERCEAELESLRRDGERIEVEVRTIPVLHRGEPHVLAMIRDMTERKRAEAAARASEEQYREIFNASVDGLALWDERGRIVDVNPAFLAMHGFARDEIVDADCPAFIPEDGRDACARLVRAALAGERSQGEHIALHKSGVLRNVEIRAVPIRYHGQPHALTVVRDITERKRTDAALRASEAQLRQAQKMEAIGQLTGGIAHDFNNILQSIVGYVVLAEERQDELDDPRLGGYLARIHASTRRASELIGQMLTFSRGQRGERRALSLAPLVQEATQMLRSTLPSTITLRTERAAEVPSVLADPVQFEQVLLNLSINARDAMCGLGEILVSTEVTDVHDAVCASCRKRIEGSFVALAVRDSGPGIPAAIAERIFEPFFTTKDVGKGSGMGLAMVHGIVHDHGGHLLLDTAPGTGTTVRVLLPPLAAASSSSSQEPGGRPPTRRKPRLRGRVLVADDEAAVRELLRELLTGWGLDVALARTGAEAAAVFAAEPARFDLVLTDQTMPEMTGLALAREVNRRRPDIPILLCTGFGDALTDQDITAAGISAVARKPVEPSDLYAMLGRHLGAEPEGA
jgi:PAS domain S-box-containing protein